MPRRKSIGLLDVLSNVAEFFIEQLREEKCLRNARLICRQLRDLVDSSISSIIIDLREEDLGLWHKGERPPLWRWPGCKEVDVLLLDGVQDPRLLAIPFMGLPLEHRQHITTLTVGCQCDAVALSGTEVSTLLRTLPALQSIAFDFGLTDDDNGLGEQLICDALASLPSLEELHYNSGSVGLSRVHLLAGSLKKLTITGARNLKEDTLSSIRRLTQLQELNVSGIIPVDDDAGWESLADLIGCLQPSIRTLGLPAPYSAMVLGLSDGRIVSVEVPQRIPLAALAQVAARVLLPSGRIAPRVQNLSVAYLYVCSSAGGRELRQLRALLQVVDRVDIQETRISRDVPLALAVEILDMLCDGVKLLQLDVVHNAQVYFRMDTPPPASAAATAATSTVAASSSSAAAAAATNATAAAVVPPQGDGRRTPLLTPAAPPLLDLALELLAAAAVGGRSEAAAPSATATGAPPSPPCSIEAPRSSGGIVTSAGGGITGAHASRVAACQQPLLMLRGPMLADLAARPGEASALRAWVRKLGRQATEGIQLAGGGDAEARARMEYIVLPGAAGSCAVLLHCADAKKLAMTAAMARAVALAAAGGAAAGPLQVLPAAAHPTGDKEGVPRRAFYRAVSQVMQHVWAGEGPSAGWSARQRLRWLLEQWSLIRDLPRKVYVL